MKYKSNLGKYGKYFKKTLRKATNKNGFPFWEPIGGKEGSKP